MMFFPRRLAMIAAGLLLSSAMTLTQAAGLGGNPTETIKTLYAQGQFEQAYQLGRAAEFNWEGDPEFDFNYGLAAIESGHYEDAIFALERVVFLRPDILRLRLELARAHFLNENFVAARAEFQRVLDRSPPPNVQENIARFLAQMDAAQLAKRRQITGWGQLRGGYDTNVNSATEAEAITTPLGTFDLRGDGRAQSDEFTRWEVGASWREPLDKRRTLDFRAVANLKNNLSTDAFDLGSLGLDATYTTQYDFGTLRWGARTQTVRLDSEVFQRAYGLSVGMDRELAKGWLLSLSAAGTRIRFENGGELDTNQLLMSATVLRPTERAIHSLTLYQALEPTEHGGLGKHNGRKFHGLFYGLQVPGQRYQPYLRLGAQKTNYDDTQPVFAVVRDDTMLTATAGVRVPLWKGGEFSLEGVYSEVDSNIVVFSNDRYSIEAGFRHSF